MHNRTKDRGERTSGESKKHLIPRWGKKPLNAVTRADVAELHAAIGTSTKYEANQVLALVGIIFTKAHDWGRGMKLYPTLLIQ